MKRALVSGIAVVVLCVAAGPPIAKRGDGSGSGAFLPAPHTQPGALAAAVVRWTFAGRYRLVWATLQPRDRRATTWTFWRGCQRRHRGHLEAVDVEGSAPERGAVAVSVAFTVDGRRTLTVSYWTRYRGRWKRVWSAAAARAYRSRRCPASALG
jgi:hypothetical protein